MLCPIKITDDSFSKQRLLILNPFPVARRVEQAREQAPEHVRDRRAEAPCRAGARRLLLRRVAWNGRRWLVLVLLSSQIDVHELALLLQPRQHRWRRGPGGCGCRMWHHPLISSRTKKSSAIVVRERELVDGFSYVTYLPVLLSIKPSSPRRRGARLALRCRPRSTSCQKPRNGLSCETRPSASPLPSRFGVWTQSDRFVMIAQERNTFS